MAIQLIPLAVAIVGGAATVGAGVYAYKSYSDAQTNIAPVALIQPAAKLPLKPELKPQEEKQPEVEIVQEKLPQFDLLRVEKDGSVVVAGSAPPNNLVEIIQGNETLAKTKSVSNGDFIVIFDNPLKPGTYELYIRATGKDGKIVLSQEAGLISIPEEGDELIAMVSKPGVASKLIQVPEPGAMPVEKLEPVEKPKSVVTTQPVEQPKAVAKTQPVEQPKPVAKTQPVEQPKPVAKTQPVEQPKQIAILEPEQAPQPVAKAVPVPAPRPTKQIAKLSSPEPVVKTETAPKPEPIAKIEAQPAPKKLAKVKKQEAPITVVKVEPPKPAIKKVAKPKPVILRSVFLGAVEVEGEKIFIAGTGEPNRVINIYVDGKFVGAARVNAQGSYLLEANSKLKIGEHVIRADMLAKSSAQVVARAEVPLIHDAPQNPTPKPIVTANAPLPKPAKIAKPTRITQPAKVVENKKAIETEINSEPVKIVETAKVKLPAKIIETAKVVEAAKIKAPVKAVETAKVKQPVKVVETAKTKRPKKIIEVAKTKPPATVIETAKLVEQPKVAQGTPSQTRQLNPVEKSEQPPKPKTVIVAAQPAVVVRQKRVIRTSSSVIIRKGDNLWRISRRILGRGIRYSTIYQANREQIKNPNLIFPGQIFSVPEKLVGIDGSDRG